MKETLKAFIVTFQIDNEKELRSVVVIAYSKKEAGNIFIEWTTNKEMYDKIVAIVVQKTRKTKSNMHMLTKDFYDKQNDFVYNMRKDNKA